MIRTGDYDPNEKFKPHLEGESKLPSKRNCTDVPCFVLFIIYSIFMGYITYSSMKTADLTKIGRPTDYDG